MTKNIPNSKLLQWIPTVQDFLDEEPTQPMVRESLEDIGARWRQALRDMAQGLTK